MSKFLTVLTAVLWNQNFDEICNMCRVLPPDIKTENSVIYKLRCLKFHQQLIFFGSFFCAARLLRANILQPPCGKALFCIYCWELKIWSLKWDYQNSPAHKESNAEQADNTDCFLSYVFSPLSRILLVKPTFLKCLVLGSLRFLLFIFEKDCLSIIIFISLSLGYHLATAGCCHWTDPTGGALLQSSVRWDSSSSTQYLHYRYLTFQCF